jgi:hypothetical protein
MRENRGWIIFTLVLTLAMILPMASMASPENQTLNTGSMRVIVELTDAPLATYQGGVPELRATDPQGGKLDLTSPAAQAYLDYLGERHAEFTATLDKAMPGAAMATYVTEASVSKSLDYCYRPNCLINVWPN